MCNHGLHGHLGEQKYKNLKISHASLWLLLKKIVCACICMKVSYCIISSLSFFFMYNLILLHNFFFVCVAQASALYCQAIWHVDTWIKTPLISCHLPANLMKSLL